MERYKDWGHFNRTGENLIRTGVDDRELGRVAGRNQGFPAPD